LKTDNITFLPSFRVIDLPVSEQSISAVSTANNAKADSEELRSRFTPSREDSDPERMNLLSPRFGELTNGSKGHRGGNTVSRFSRELQLGAVGFLGPRFKSDNSRRSYEKHSEVLIRGSAGSFDCDRVC
jgi:hypothetical protein